MANRTNKILAALFLAVLSLLAAGCRSDQYHQSRAADKARAYLLEHAAELTPEEVYYVKFHDPVLLTGPIVGTKAGNREEEHLNSEQMQICVSWQIPGREYVYMVYGTSDGSMALWEPIRMIRKKFDIAVPPEAAAVAAARKYALDSLFEQLTVAETNKVRFYDPTIAETAFQLSLNPDGKLTPEEVDEKREKIAEMKQISLAWQSPEHPDRLIVFCGMAKDEGFSGWSVNFAGLMSRGEFDESVAAAKAAAEKAAAEAAKAEAEKAEAEKAETEKAAADDTEAKTSADTEKTETAADGAEAKPAADAEKPEAAADGGAEAKPAADAGKD